MLTQKKVCKTHKLLPFDINKSIEKDELKPILGYLTKHIHQHGCFKKANNLVMDMCGEELNAQYYINYLESKFSEIYGL